jgi:hypothetical protein
MRDFRRISSWGAADAGLALPAHRMMVLRTGLEANRKVQRRKTFNPAGSIRWRVMKNLEHENDTL